MISDIVVREMQHHLDSGTAEPTSELPDAELDLVSRFSIFKETPIISFFPQSANGNRLKSLYTLNLFTCRPTKGSNLQFQLSADTVSELKGIIYAKRSGSNDDDDE